MDTSVFQDNLLHIIKFLFYLWSNSSSFFTQIAILSLLRSSSFITQIHLYLDSFSFFTQMIHVPSLFRFLFLLYSDSSSFFTQIHVPSLLRSSFFLIRSSFFFTQITLPSLLKFLFLLYSDSYFFYSILLPIHLEPLELTQKIGCKLHNLSFGAANSWFSKNVFTLSIKIYINKYLTM